MPVSPDECAVFADPPDLVGNEFIRRGVPYEDKAAVSRRQLASLGVMNVETIPRFVAGTEAEGDVLPSWCENHHVRSLVVVTTPDHSRRVRRVLHRAMRGTSTMIAIRPARYSAFQREHWWQTRDGARVGIVELEKLLLDLIRHPMS